MQRILLQFLICFIFYSTTVENINFQMYRNSYNTLTGFSPAQGPPSQPRYTTTSGGFQRTPLYPIGPTLTQPQFKPVQRGMSPSPYLNREGMKPPSYETRYLQKTQVGFNTLTHEQRQKRLIERNQKQIQQEEKRREQIRLSYERQIKAITAKLNRNLQQKEKLHGQIETLQRSQFQLNQKLSSLRPPERSTSDFQSIDRKQQQIIILKSKLMTTMRENQSELNQKQEQEEKYWEEQIAQKQKILFQLQQNLRDKRLELHSQKQKSLQKPDFLSIEQEVRATHYQQFVAEYENLERRLKNLTDQRDKLNKEINDVIELKKPQFHNANVRREQLKRQFTNLQLRVFELGRISAEMSAANQNLQKELERKQTMISKYETDIEELKAKKQQTDAYIGDLMNSARERDISSLSKSLSDVYAKIQEDIRLQQAKGSRLKNAYQKLYELLCSAVRKDIQQTFNDTVSA